MLINLKELLNYTNKKIIGVIHVGAHYGEEFHEYLDNGFKYIHAFEPLNENFKVLETKFNKNKKIFLYKTALGNKTGEVNMYLSSNNLESSSILKPYLHLNQHKNVKFSGYEKVKLDKLDNFKINKECNFLNLDVQGYELEVLRGSNNILGQIDIINCEINNDETYKNNPLVSEIDKYLEKYNFKRVKTKWAGENLTWGDAIYVKNYKFSKLSFIQKIKILINN